MIAGEVIEGLLNKGTDFLKSGRYAKAIECFDEILFYDPECGEALIGKSHALFGERHFVKALRYYRCAASTSNDLRDAEYHRLLLEKSNEERDNFPKLKQFIYAGDEHFAGGEYEKALENYENALAIPSKLKEKILFKLINKRATTYLKLNDFESALVCFNESLNALNNDYAWYGKGVCQYELNIEGACESLGHAVKLTKGQLLDKGLVLNELGCYP
ncbi:tetratricopeptide repeat protein, partial [Methanobrevibacter sp.]|uniref:tetratricopeptide repeat protein n=1 Tax=Methanobrevibacter sp. TaxID=66852 RepID=UPI003890346F